MKKLKPRQKKYLLHKSYKAAQARSSKSKEPNPKPERYGSFINKSVYKEPQIKYTDVDAPSHFTLCNSHSGHTIQFVNAIKRARQNGQNVNVRLEQVEVIDDGAIAMLLSVVTEFKKDKLRVKGTKPLNETAKTTLEQSGFFSYFISRIAPENRHDKNTILCIGNAFTNAQKIAKTIRSAMETVWGLAQRCPLLYGGIIEMFRNSCDHAFRNEAEVVWHLAVSHNDEANSVHFSFVDNGRGILHTLNTGKLKAVINLFRGGDDILQAAFEDGIKSRTGLDWRGKGLPTIYEMLQDGIIRNLVVITNNVYLDLATGTKEVLPHSYQGTYYSWEVDTSCARKIFP